MSQVAADHTAISAERTLLGALLLMNFDAISDVVEILGETGQAFSVEKHGKWYELIVARWRRGMVTDIEAMVRSLSEFEIFQSASEIAGLSDERTTTAFAREDAEIIVERYAQRLLADGFRKAQLQAEGGRVNNVEIMEGVDHVLREAGMLVSKSKVRPVHDDFDAAIAELADIQQNGFQGGVPSGIQDVDKVTNGWKRGELIVVGARPATGKSAFILNVLLAAAKHRIAPLLFSVEMSTRQISHRLLTMESGAHLQAIYEGFKGGGDLDKIRNAAKSLKQFPIYNVDLDSGISLAEIRSKAQIFTRKHPGAVIAIDYLQLIRPPAGIKDRHVQVAEISRSLKEMARSLQVPVIAAAQLSRQAEKETDPQAMQAALRESGAIESDADVVIILSKLSKDQEDHWRKIGATELGNLVNCNITKNRQGGTGSATLVFDKKTQRMQSSTMAKEPVRPPVPSYADEWDRDSEDDDIPF